MRALGARWDRRPRGLTLLFFRLCLQAGYENVKMSTSAWDTNLVATGGTYMSVNWQVAGGGAFAM